MSVVCKECNGEGWIHHQHPLKPPGVIMSSTPCQKCNKDMKILLNNGEVTIAYQ